MSKSQNGCGSPSSNGCGSTPRSPASTTDEQIVPKELHACMGLNACKGHDRFATNDCAGMGQCATQSHVCHTLNNCRGQGGCGLYGDAAEQCKPAENDCAFQGSCATPIQAERISTLGANTGKSVWLLARELFEKRMEKSKRNVGPSPMPDGPPQKWLQSLDGGYDSCGSSGDKYCSFGFNDPAKNAQKMIARSKAELKQTVEDCDCTKDK
ncbi:hypothetical protein [Marinomonas mediterranea]|uniref:Uncharacterized protein n=1 Tax=Marinomonas mediterranea (strain ATCC 700492 / JCM 21426 / NBRC 103028 / MMB-1) TaxID=717774 RepID=F2K403_MARM1|nr:hypothetical protein [Marinomonas mediterranea]ADZ91345.1 hypothetical protein Marme_2097 [Marinomonas mediterranea MMB-1]WCN17464.1 hypothetical protein GV053_10550 [Marinomonas mediterranea MMB-1]